LTVVLDSNVAVALALDTERAPAIEDRLRTREGAKEALHAPSLFRFEVANALTRNMAANKIHSADAKVAWGKRAPGVDVDVETHLVLQVIVERPMWFTGSGARRRR
jgi:predicted nucleic acid-binding protein